MPEYPRENLVGNGRGWTAQSERSRKKKRKPIMRRMPEALRDEVDNLFEPEPA